MPKINLGHLNYDFIFAKIKKKKKFKIVFFKYEKFKRNRNKTISNLCKLLQMNNIEIIKNKLYQKKIRTSLNENQINFLIYLNKKFSFLFFQNSKNLYNLKLKLWMKIRKFYKIISIKRNFYKKNDKIINSKIIKKISYGNIRSF